MHGTMKALSYRMLVIVLGIAVAILVAFTTMVNSTPAPRNSGIDAPVHAKLAQDVLKSLARSSQKSVGQPR